MVAKKKAEFTVRTLRFKTNQLLNRKQFVVVVDHPNWNGTVPGKKIKEQLAKLYKVADEQQVAVFSLKTQFGGGQTRGFGIIYDDVASMKRIEPNYRLQRIGLGRKRMVSRKSLKERKNRVAKLRGVKKNKQGKK
uniref:40S ribosomal protein S24 n=2 Tax=Neobodo designis TaxID=312471 RepID=A0A7S1MSA4_NEODS|mmetsp:Transcript_46257/g.142685  ORF Transcript_46257/g.142685 Transcript_46257/m.142685 type:complete len:135 (+) Transcript_46257:40-444(+)|eukprot:CAMPEP_0174826668 /NCGR_PEP_ID=MMETSP1114-20130205/88_1 /TAXON_ID=312471 /ORGANISM="Neobodo designis, Strain CCAP 1951/1" /LENGTH=134 /DNA_ID=CAMNT_0016060211 /DNA_START=50 /DNA_END=454 /DNA_ORIENTATION=-